MLAAVGDQNILSSIAESIIPLELLGNCLAQFGFTSYWAIARLTLSESGLGCSSNMGRRIKIGFADAKADHINALSFHRFGLGIDSQRHRWSDL